MALTCVRTTDIGVRYDDVNNVIVLPIEADADGVWTILFNDDSTDTVDTTTGTLLAFPVASFTNDSEHLFKIKRPNKSTYGNTCYRTQLLHETITPVESFGGSGKISITIDESTTTGYTNNDLKNLSLYSVFKNGTLQESGIGYTAATGAFTWSFADTDNVTILYTK